MKYLTAFHHESRQRRGFTLAETLIVIAILAILMALLIPNLVQTQRDLRQKELDAKAEIIYVAAQNELVKLRASGNVSKYSDLRDGVSVGDGLRLLSSNDSITTAKENWLSGVAADDLLVSGHYWVVVYNADTASVVEVYYSENGAKEDFCSYGYNTYDSVKEAYEGYAEDGGTEQSIRDTKRYKAGAFVGFYNGSMTGGDGGATSVKKDLIPHIGHNNNGNYEKLVVTLTCPVPADVSYRNLEFYFTMSGQESGAVYSATYTYITNDYFPRAIGEYENNSVTIELTLDDLSSYQTRFSTLFGKDTYDFTPGENLQMELTVVDSSNPLVRGVATPATVNSLFGQNTTGDSSVAYIQCGRHLQNLDKSSDVGNLIKSAVQTKSINFGNSSNTDVEWLSCYKKNYFNGKQQSLPRFKPIENDYLDSYTSDSNCTIKWLNTGVAGTKTEAGLFACFEGSTLKGIILESPYVLASGGNAGGLAGTMQGSGTIKIENCGVRLESDDYSDGPHKKPQNFNWISGTNVGGLVGQYSGSGSLEITESYAATTLYGADAGGLIGNVSAGALSVKKSYADCYATGRYIGGLVGSGSVKSIESSYAAGYLKSPVQSMGDAAGFTNGNVETLKYSYTVCDLVAKNKFAIAASSTNPPEHVYYLSGSSESISDLGATPISKDTKPGMLSGLNTGNPNNPAGGETFRKGTGGVNPRLYAVPYNLDKASRLPAGYDYPSLMEIQHFGDWVAELNVGSLVYYEAYVDRLTGDYSYGFFGGGSITSSLRDDEGVILIGDGYGVLAERTLDQFTVTIDDGQPPITLGGPGGEYYSVTIGDFRYLIYPLPAERLNSAPGATGNAGFWRKATVLTKEYGEYESYFNPLLAKTVQFAMEIKPSYPESLPVRSPRQLFALGTWYSYYWNDWAPHLEQERDIDYSTYWWSTFYDSRVSTITEQLPIGYENAFRGRYDGNNHLITNISFSTGAYENLYNVGLFGVTSVYSTIQNVVVAVDYNPDAFWRAERHVAIKNGQTANIGVLVGHNYGTISNCAVAGYRVAASDQATLYTYADGTVRAGGLVGRNDGNITNSSAVLPDFHLNATYSTEVLAGGLVGWNIGSVTNSYCLANMTGEARASTVKMSGFAGSNTGGQILASYCGTALVSSGTTKAYCFAPAEGGVLRDNYYLSQGTYSLAGILHNYDSGEGAAGCIPRTYQQMKDVSSLAKVNYAAKHPLTTADAYPFRGFVTRNGVYAHYGDWQVEPMLGEIGIFYWEKEVDGTNAGYHFSALGTCHDPDDLTKKTILPRAASTLCTAHDDGGRIEAYGYGYYYDETYEGKVSFGKANTDGTNGIIAQRNAATDSPTSAAKAALQQQIKGYVFVPYLTQYSTESSADCLYLTQGSHTVATDPVTNGTWTLSFDYDGDGEARSYSYKLSPFFANALSRVENAPLPKGQNAKEWDVPGSTSKTPEAERNPYEIRSVQQLQYINWNATEKNCTKLVTNTNKKQFPFLQYGYAEGGHEQTRDEAEQDRPCQFWIQSHDVLGMTTGADGTLVPVENYTPIAGKATSSPRDKHDNPLHAWFGGSYDGQSYKIQNLNIKSDSYTVGLFGATAGAEIHNIIMYGDGDTVVERNTSLNNGVGTNRGAYQLGGLVGLAYDYRINSLTEETASTISNCAIAGYHIVDNSENMHGLGYASIGGLFGISLTKLQSCSAVVDFDINYHSPKNKPENQTYSKYGNMLRIGGITGTGLFRITDCYSGGHFNFDKDTLEEPPMGYDGDTSKYWKRNDSLIIFVGGIAGSAYKNNIMNFTNNSGGATDGEVTLTNCYTYLELPPMKGNVRSVSIFVGFGDRAGAEQSGKATMLHTENCYYLESSVLGGLTMDQWCEENYAHPEFWLYYPDNKDKKESGPLTKEEVQKVLYGNMDSIGDKVLCHSGTNKRVNPDSNQQKARSYYEFDVFDSGTVLSELKGTDGPWAVVTYEENNNNVSGKYSFSDDDSQQGMDYPFPAVVRQVDNDEDPNNDPLVHYGAWPWPTAGAHWEYSRPEMDIFQTMTTKAADLDPNTKEEPSTVKLTLTAPAGSNQKITDESGNITVEPAGPTVGPVVPAADGKSAVVTLSGVKPGTSVKVTEANTGAEAETKLWPAEKEFSLILDSPIELPEIDDFIISEANRDKVQVVRTRWAKKAGTNEDDTSVVLVTFRALSTGSGITIKEKNTQAICTLTITAQMDIKGVYPPEDPNDPNEAEKLVDLITVSTDPVTFTCSSYCEVPNEDDPNAAPTIKDYTSAGSWSYEPGAGLRIESSGDLNNTFTVTPDSVGSDTLTVAYTYDHWGVTLRSTKAFPVRTLGYVALSNGTEYVKHQRLEVETEENTQSEKTENPEGLDMPQGADLFLFAPAADTDLAQFGIEVLSVEAQNPETGELILDPETGEPVAANDVTISPFGGSGYAAKVVSDKEYSYLGFTARLDSDAQENQKLVRVTQKLTDPRNDDPNHEKTWTLQIDDVRACRLVIQYNKNDNNAPENLSNVKGSMLPSGIFVDGEDSNPLSPCGFTKTGYVCKGWDLEPNRTEGDPDYLPEQPFTAEDLEKAGLAPTETVLTLYAHWEPITYIVRLEPNNWLDGSKAVSLRFTYDDDQYSKLPVNPADNIGVDTDPEYYNADFDETLEPSTDNPEKIRVYFEKPEWSEGFDNWNTEADGTGTKYTDGAMNLTDLAADENGDPITITLYAQWKISALLTLRAEGNPEQVFKMSVGLNGLPKSMANEEYKAPNPPHDGWVLDGWYFIEGGEATKVLDAEGGIVGDCSGITETKDGEQQFVMVLPATLDARWFRPYDLTLKYGDGETEFHKFSRINYPPFTSLGEEYTTARSAGFPDTPDTRELDGWYTTATGGQKILNADGTVVKAAYTGDFFKVEATEGTTGEMTLMDDRATLYAHWYTPHTLTLSMKNEYEEYSVYASSSHMSNASFGSLGSDEYTRPLDTDEKVLAGWFTAQDGGKMILNADGTVVNAAYTGDSFKVETTEGTTGAMTLTADLTLYAHWTPMVSLTLTDYGSYKFESGVPFSALPEGYTAPTPAIAGYTLVGWYTAAEDGEGVYKILNANGTVNGEAVSGEGYTVSQTGDAWTLTLTGDLTLYPHWNTGVTLTLNTVGDYTVTAGVSFNDLKTVSSYTKPEEPQNGWTLDGWYTAADSSGVRVMDEDGIVESITYSDSTGLLQITDGQMTLAGNVTLYPRWRRAAYTQTDTLEAGTYLIASSLTNNATSKKVSLLGANSNLNGIASQEAALIENPLGALACFDGENGTVGAFFTEDTISKLTNVAWNVFESTKPEFAGYYCFSFPMTNGGKLYLRQSGTTIETKNTEGNKHCFVYSAIEGMNYLRTQFQITNNFSDQTDHNYHIYWKSGWKAHKTDMDKTCYLFKLQTIYTFNPTNPS